MQVRRRSDMSMSQSWARRRNASCSSKESRTVCEASRFGGIDVVLDCLDWRRVLDCIQIGVDFEDRNIFDLPVQQPRQRCFLDTHPSSELSLRQPFTLTIKFGSF